MCFENLDKTISMKKIYLEFSEGSYCYNLTIIIIIVYYTVFLKTYWLLWSSFRNIHYWIMKLVELFIIIYYLIIYYY